VSRVRLLALLIVLCGCSKTTAPAPRDPYAGTYGRYRGLVVVSGVAQDSMYLVVVPGHPSPSCSLWVDGRFVPTVLLPPPSEANPLQFEADSCTLQNNPIPNSVWVGGRGGPPDFPLAGNVNYDMATRGQFYALCVPPCSSP
jgi:hypothetical protein